MSIVDIPAVSTPGVGYVFTGSYTGRVDLLVSVTSSGSDAIDNPGFLGATLDNFGYVSSTWGLGNGVAFGPGAGNGHIINEISGSISGGWAGVVADGLGDTIDNYGNISGGFDAVIFDYGSAGTVLNNHLLISGGQYAGVELRSVAHSDHSYINNTGTIIGAYGIIVDTAADSTTSITNANSGIIESESGFSWGHGIAIVQGAISLHNHGTINHGIYEGYGDAGGNNGIANDGTITGGITLADGNNGINNVGVISGGITLGGGNNVITNVGVISGGITLGNGNNSYEGIAGQVDQITCGNGEDQIILGNGNTLVSLANGHDLVTAGWGEDTFRFTSHLQVDQISGFNPILDHILLSKAAFAHIASHQGVLAAADFHVGSHAMTSSQHIIYNSKNGFLYYDRDGSGPAHEVHFATLAPHLALAAHDFLVSA